MISSQTTKISAPGREIRYWLRPQRIAPIIKALGAAGGLLVAGCKPPTAGAAAHAGHADGGSGEGAHVKGGICQEHRVPEGACGICNPNKIATLKPGESLQLRLASNTSAEVAGVKTSKVGEGMVADAIECYAEVGFDLNHFAQIAAPVGGVIQEVCADLGRKVLDKQPVARIWSAQIAEAVAKAVLTHQTLEREQKLRVQQVTSEKTLQEAQAAHRSACQSLHPFGLTEARIDELSRQPEEVVLLDACTPFAGEIISRTAVRGALVEAGKPLFTLADLSVMWADLAVPEAALARLKTGQLVELTVDSLPERKFVGKLSWISAELDETTRLVRARAEVPNPDGALKARMFAKARVETADASSALFVSATAIQRIDGKPFVFVKLENDLFDARAVRVGARTGDAWIIAEGLQPDEEVATEHGFALKSQLLISRLGAGCADD
ncbi:MAG: efflux RND transporter periplasmic adaptor subunit [Verrucomicrobiota bacterium]